MPAAEKARHSLSKCLVCVTQFEQLQKQFPLMALFSPPQNENAPVSLERIDECCYQATGKPFAEPFAELSANLGYKSRSEVERIVKQAEKKAACKTQQTYLAECKQQLEVSALQAVYTTDTSFSKYEKMRRAQYFDPPSKAHSSTKKRYPLRPDECDRHDKLCQTLVNWEHNAVGTDRSHKIKLHLVLYSLLLHLPFPCIDACVSSSLAYRQVYWAQRL